MATDRTADQRADDGARGVRSGLVAPLAVAGGLAAGALLLSGPARGLLAAVPACPFRTLTGLDCPFCGGTRAALSLVRGDVAGAADFNLLVTVAAFVSVGVLAWWLATRRRPALPGRGSAVGSTRGLVVVVTVAVVTFWVVRNLPFLPYLASAT